MSFRYLDHPTHYNSHRYPSHYRHHHHGREYHQDLHYYNRQQQQQLYYDHVRKQHHYYPQQQQLLLPRQSISMDTASYYHDNDDDDDDRDNDWYHYEQQQQQRRRTRIKKKKKIMLDEDGEPLTDLEILALKNAAKNERESKISYQELVDKEEEDTMIEGDDLSSVMESLTIENSISTTTSSTTSSTIVVDEEEDHHHKKTPTTTNIPKKKRWPFSFLFKKDTPTPTPTSQSPITPVLSPDNDSSISTLIEQQQQQQEHPSNGSWALKYNLVPMTTTTPVWIKFDNENQKKIFQHIKDEEIIQFTDSHICHGQLPIAVVPIQMKCYIPTDIAANHIASFELHFIPHL